MLDLKSTAPNIESIDQNGQTIKLSNWIGDKYIVLFFYPKDFTPGCVKEACGFAREYDALCENGEVEIIGVSGDTTGSHQKFTDTYGEIRKDPPPFPSWSGLKPGYHFQLLDISSRLS